MSVLMQAVPKLLIQSLCSLSYPARWLVPWLSSIEAALPCRAAHACAGAGHADGAQAAGALALHEGAN